MKKQHTTFYSIASLASAFLAGLSLIFLASLVALGQTVNMPDESAEEENVSVRGIAFPVAELGNCASKDECKNYCNEPANMDACISFAKTHGLMTQKDAERAEKFTKHVREGSGPGQCNSPESCEEYCSNISHLDECTSFAEKNGFKDEHYEQGKKIQSFLKKGGATPGNCKTKQECEAYCGNFSHAKECFEFAQKAGIMKKDDRGGIKSGHEPSADQLGKIAELAEKGETPGKCASKDECEKYCSDASHRDECLDFGVKAGFMHPDEAAKIKQMGGKGPGDCNSQESCHAYCNDQSHHEECFKFAEEHGLITKEEAEQAKEGWVRARQGFENAPKEVRECLETTLGANILEEIQSGKLVPGPDIGNQMRGCFEKFGGNARPQEAMKNIPPEATACLKEKFGDDFEKIRTGKAPMTPEMADSFRGCFEKMDAHEGFETEENGAVQQRSLQQKEGRLYERRTPQMEIENILRSAPPEVSRCIKEKFPAGLNNFPSEGSQTDMLAEVKEKIQQCFQNIHPEGNLRDPNIPAGQNFEGEPMAPKTQDIVGGSGSGLSHIPPEVLSCIRETVGEEGFRKLETAPASPELVSVIKICVEKIEQVMGNEQYMRPKEDPNVSDPMGFLEKLIGAALLSLRWILGK